MEIIKGIIRTRANIKPTDIELIGINVNNSVIVKYNIGSKVNYFLFMNYFGYKIDFIK